MSWWAQSITNTLRLNDPEPDPEPDNQNPTIRDDISELTDTLSRNFWGVASSFLSPPQPSSSDVTDDDVEGADVADDDVATGIKTDLSKVGGRVRSVASVLSPPLQTDDSSSHDVACDDVASGIRTDLSEIGGRVLSGIYSIARTDADVEGDDVASGIRTDLSEIGGRVRSGIYSIVKTDYFSKLASDLLKIREEEEGADDDVGKVGVTEETVAFARGVASRAETWLDFPMDNEFAGFYDEFDMSDAQQDHALAIERLVPKLAALRIELCPEYMSENCFWMIYFVLLHPRLSEQDAEILSTPEILKARTLLTQEMQNRTMEKSKKNQPVRGSYFTSDTNITPVEPVPSESGTSSLDDKFATDKHPILTPETPIVDKSVIKEQTKNSEDEADDWLREENSDTSGVGTRTIPIENDEDVSFSDLEEDDENASTSYKKVTYGSDSSTKESRDWVQLERSSTDTKVSAPNSDTKESSDWLDLEEIDVE